MENELRCYHGTLEHSDGPCAVFVASETGERYAVVGDVEASKPGMPLIVCGYLVAAPFCSEAQALAVVSSSRPKPTDGMLHQHTRNVRVTVTAWSGDLSPTFRLEGREFGLALDVSDRKWAGFFWDVEIVGTLEIDFFSRAPLGKEFELVVEASTEGDQATKKKKAFTRRAGPKGVRFLESMAVVS